MPQIQLPFFPEGVTHITPLLAFCAKEGRITYFNGNMPVFVHEQTDIASFRMITAQFCVTGNAKQSEVAKAFGIPKITLKRAVKLYRAEGPKGFYRPRQTRGAAVLTAPVLAEDVDCGYFAVLLRNLGHDDIEIVYRPRFILVGGDGYGLPCRLYCLVLHLSLILQDAKGSQIVLYLLESREHRLTIRRHSRIIGCSRLCRLCPS